MPAPFCGLPVEVVRLQLRRYLRRYGKGLEPALADALDAYAVGQRARQCARRLGCHPWTFTRKIRVCLAALKRAEGDAPWTDSDVTTVANLERSPAWEPRSCRRCGRAFQPRAFNQQYHSPRCASAVYVERRRERRATA